MLLQDNKSAILLEQNGRQSAGERTQALNIQYFMITDHINKDELRRRDTVKIKMLRQLAVSVVLFSSVLARKYFLDA